MPQWCKEHGYHTRAIGKIEHGNLVDEVRYWDGGRWSFWADGRGASLELIDPHQDNDFALAWEASDESEKTEWEEEVTGDEHNAGMRRTQNKEERSRLKNEQTHNLTLNDIAITEHRTYRANKSAWF